MNRLNQLDALELLENLDEADAEYFRIKIARCKSNDEAEKYRKQLALIEETLAIAHKARVRALK